MKDLFSIILLIVFCMTLNPIFAKDDVVSNTNDLISDDQGKEVSLKAQKKTKNKKGERNIKVQGDKEADKNIILDLDKI